METVEKSIEVAAPVSTVYNQWTQFEEFPQFMEGVEDVQQITDKRLHWKANIGGVDKEWDADIVEQVPDTRIAWRSVDRPANAGAVSFTAVTSASTRVTVKINYEPESAIEKAGDALGFVSRRIEGDLKRFKEFIEARGTETGGWRGEIRGKQVRPEEPSQPRSKRIREP